MYIYMYIYIYIYIYYSIRSSLYSFLTVYIQRFKCFLIMISLLQFTSLLSHNILFALFFILFFSNLCSRVAKTILQFSAEIFKITIYFVKRVRGSLYVLVRQASSPCRDDFYPTFIWNLLSQFNQNAAVFYVCYVCHVCDVAKKGMLDQVVFTINSDVKPSCRTNVLILFN